MVKGPTGMGPIPNTSGIVNSCGISRSTGCTIKPPCAEHIENHERYADVNGGIGHIESPEVPAATVEVEEVEHVAVEDAIDQVADRTANHERQPEPSQPLLGRKHRHVDRQPDQRRALQEREHGRLERKIDAVHEAESGPSVMDPGEAEKAG